MTYKEEFVDACDYFHTLNGEASHKRQSAEEIGKIIDELQDHENAAMYRKLAQHIRELSEVYLKNMAFDDVANKCHVVSSGVNDLFQQTKFAEGFALSVTVGNVSYKNEFLYETSKEEIASILLKGRTREVLNVHVWLTLENMTIIDPSINFTLAKRGKIKEKVLRRSPVRIINPGEKTDFKYFPMLVDNEFAHTVDEIGYKPIRAL